MTTQSTIVQPGAGAPRSADTPPARKPPVFVVGCHRSGTSFLYHCLLSSGDFVVYRSDSGIWERLLPIFGDPAVLTNRKKMIAAWLRSKLFRRSGLEAEKISTRLLAEGKTGGDFLRVVMEEMGRLQNANRWASWDPDNTFYMPIIKREIPDAQFIHIIRDGRDIATVLDTKGWIKPFPWDRKKSLLVAGIFWEFMVAEGRKYGAMMKDSYLEVRYEDLAMRTPETLAKIGAFIGHDMSHERILQSGVGAVSDPNSTFKSEFNEGHFNPVGRWKQKLSPENVAALEQVIGGLLGELDYPLAYPGQAPLSRLDASSLRTLYLSYFRSKQWLKSNTPLGRFASAEPLELA